MFLWPLFLSIAPLLLTTVVWLVFGIRRMGKWTTALGFVFLWATWWSGYEFMRLEAAYQSASISRSTSNVLYEVVVANNSKVKDKLRVILEKQVNIPNKDLGRMLDECLE